MGGRVSSSSINVGLVCTRISPMLSLSAFSSCGSLSLSLSLSVSLAFVLASSSSRRRRRRRRMCQGVFPPAFNPCDCSSSELSSYDQPRKLAQQKQQPSHAAPPSSGAIPPDLLERVHRSSLHATSLLARWASAARPGQPPARIAQAADGRRPLSPPNPADGKLSDASNRVDAPHFVHAFFFDST